MTRNDHYTAHPRVCGENLIHYLDSLSHAGSSPRVRGKQLDSQARCQAHRLIPACAGKTNGSTSA